MLIRKILSDIKATYNSFIVTAKQTLLLKCIKGMNTTTFFVFMIHQGSGVWKERTQHYTMLVLDKQLVSVCVNNYIDYYKQLLDAFMMININLYNGIC